jgi:c(7)-type cytochrome triheme protein
MDLMGHPYFSHRRLFGILLVISLSALTAISCNPKTRAKSPLEIAMEATRTAPSSVPQGVPPPLQAPLAQEVKEEIPEDVIDALAEILLESEGEESHPLPFYFLPQNEHGDVDWVSSIELGVIDPLDDLDGKKGMPPMDFNVVFKVKGDLPDVVYPHYPHTLWLDCKNCHPSIFIMRAGVNKVTMDAIAKGEFCGRCHGKVAFTLSDCNRCHSRPKPGKSLIIPRARG